MADDLDDDGPGNDPPVIWQPRCIFCGLEHYIIATLAISRGEAACHNCGRVPPVFHDRDEYLARLAQGARAGGRAPGPDR